MADALMDRALSLDVLFALSTKPFVTLGVIKPIDAARVFALPGPARSRHLQHEARPVCIFLMRKIESGGYLSERGGQRQRLCCCLTATVAIERDGGKAVAGDENMLRDDPLEICIECADDPVGITSGSDEYLRHGITRNP